MILPLLLDSNAAGTTDSSCVNNTSKLSFIYLEEQSKAVIKYKSCKMCVISYIFTFSWCLIMS